MTPHPPTSPAAIFVGYLAAFPDEAAMQFQAAGLFASCTAEQSIDRSHIAGHITASALVIHRESAQAVLIRHKSLGRWLQPGGHVEPGDPSPLDAAIRELREEVGIAADRLRLVPPAASPLVPMDIDSHPIPANPRRGEPAHLHHDFRYLFTVDDLTLATDLREVDDCRWFPLDHDTTASAFPRLLAKSRARLGL